jgi:hypothetical protein
MSATNEPTASPPSGTICALDLDIHLLIAASLAPSDLLSLGATCGELRDVCLHDTLWNFHFKGSRNKFPGVHIGSRGSRRVFEDYSEAVFLLEERQARRDAQLLADYQHGRDFSQLRKFGTVTGAFSADASFEPRGGQMPRQIPGAAVLELHKLLSECATTRTSARTPRHVTCASSSPVARVGDGSAHGHSHCKLVCCRREEGCADKRARKSSARAASARSMQNKYVKYHGIGPVSPSVSAVTETCVRTPKPGVKCEYIRTGL